MHHFLFEFITGGGLSHQTLPERFISEGEIMLQALLRDLNQLDDTRISITRDSRLDLFENNVRQYVVEEGFKEKLPDFFKEADVLWLIAPERDDCLKEYADLFITQDKLFIGSTPDAIKIATSKYLTSKILSNENINIVETKWLSEGFPESVTGLVVKPDDGIGGEQVCYFDDEDSLTRFTNEFVTENFIVQPFIKGEYLSMSLLVFEGDVKLLACNKQFVDIKNDSIDLIAIGVNESLSFKDDMLKLARKIVSTIPGFAGYIGVDLIGVDNELFVLEINPRFTTAYAGISESIKCNVTSKILDTFVNKKIPEIAIDLAIPVRITI